MAAAPFDRRAHPPEARFSTWRARDGWSIRVIDWPQQAKEARGSLLFFGGRGDFIEKYLEPLHHWRSGGWNVASLDWRSQGSSRGDIQYGHLDSFEPLVADGAAFIDEWIRSTPGPHVAVGHSMGGHLLLRMIAEHRPALQAAVLVAPMIGINTAPLPECVAVSIAQTFCLLGWSKVPAWRQSERRAPAGSQRQRYLTSCPDRYSDELWWLERQPDYGLGPPTWGWLAAAYKSIANLTPDVLRRVELPILLLGAERDRLVSAEAIRGAALLLPQSQLLMFEDAAHEILREADPVRLRALGCIDRFFEEHAKG